MASSGVGDGEGEVGQALDDGPRDNEWLLARQPLGESGDEEGRQEVGGAEGRDRAEREVGAGEVVDEEG